MIKVKGKQVAPANSIDTILAQRGQEYGKFINHASITQDLKQSLYAHIIRHNKELANDQLEAIDMICHKLGRIVNGNPNNVDSWRDISGYAELVASRLEGEVK